MAGKMKFHPQTLSLRAAAALILLSGTVESLRCYWCGPLAEQVHRSQRAPPCDSLMDQVTACEPGYTHCAVVASSPPFVESRYCVKFYQDECYKLYCNTTKTFKMTCPCRGELCNGANTQREIDAFAVIAKAVAKTQNSRLKKRETNDSNNFVESNKDESENLVKSDEHTMNNNTTNIESIVSEETKTNNNVQMNNLINDTMLSDQPLIQKDNSENAVDSEHAEMNDETDMAQTTGKNDEESNKHILETTSPKIMEEHVDSNIMNTKVSEPAMGQQLAADENLLMNNDIKPSMELPTAEALQQNNGQITTSENAFDPTSPEPMHSTTESNSDTSPQSTTSSRNNARQVILSAWVVLNSFVFSTIV